MLLCCANQYITLIFKMGFLMGAADFAILIISKWGLAYRIYKPAIWGTQGQESQRCIIFFSLFSKNKGERRHVLPW